MANVLSALIHIQLNTRFYIVKSQRNSFPKLYGGLMNIIKRTYNFQTSTFFQHVRGLPSNANAKFNSKQNLSICVTTKKILVYLQEHCNET